MNVHSHTERTASPPVDRREAILQGALRLFAERGFHGTAVPAIAAEAGVATGTIYRHFANKEALVNVLYRDCKRTLMSALLEGFDFTASPREQARSLWHRLARFAQERPLAFDFLELHHHGTYLDAESLDLERSSLRPLGAFFETKAARSVIKPMPAATLVAMAWGMLSGLVKAERLGHVQWSEELVTQSEAAFWDALSVHAPGAVRAPLAPGADGAPETPGAVRAPETRS